MTNTYDTAGRLTTVSYPYSRTVSYQYDLAGQRTRLTYPDSTYISYEYDQLGRLTKVKNQAGTALAEYTYDVRSRCTNTSLANGTSIQNQFDPASRLLSITNQTNGEQHKYAYTYDIENRLTNVAHSAGGGTGPLTVALDTDLAFTTGGDIIQTHEYSIYGKVAAEDPNHTNPCLFTGQRFDVETGLYYYKARYYNPHIGRFMQTDPIGYQDGVNWYGYCGNNPAGCTDPTGELHQ